MDFNFTEEQQLLQDSIGKFFEKNYTFEMRRQILAAQQGLSPQVWEGLTSMGLLGVLIPPEHDGFGGNAVDTMIVMEALGSRLVVEPYLPTAVLGASTIVLGGTDIQRRLLLPSIVKGTLKLAFAHGEPKSRYSLSHVET